MGLGADLVDGQCLDPKIGKQLDSLILGDPSLFQVGCQIRIDILVKAAVTEGVTVGLDLQDQLDKPHSLHRLVESLCRLIGNLVADACNLEKFGLPWLLCSLRLLSRQGRKALCESLHSIDHDQDCFVELVLVDGFGLCQIQRRLERLRTLLIALQAGLQHIAIIYCQVGVAGVELTLHAEESCIHIDLHLFRNQRLSAGAEVVVLPEGSDLAQLLLSLFRNIEDIAVAFLKQIQLVQDELHRVLRKDRSAAVDRGLVADKDCLVFNINIHLGQNVLQHQRSLHDRRLIEILLIGFRSQDCALCVDIGLLIKDALAIGLHPGGQGSEMCFVFHKKLLYYHRMFSS